MTDTTQEPFEIKASMAPPGATFTRDESTGTAKVTLQDVVDVTKQDWPRSLDTSAQQPLELLGSHGAHPYALNYTRTMARWIVDGGMAPKSFKNNPAAVGIAIMHGAKLGMDPLQSVQSIAVVNGTPKVWGDAVLALIHKAGGKVLETVPKHWGEGAVAVCSVTPPGGPAVVRQFTFEEAKGAGLISKDVWRSYPKRMLQMRARALACRDAMPGALMGLGIDDEGIGLEDAAAAAQPDQIPAAPAPAGKSDLGPIPLDPVAVAFGKDAPPTAEVSETLGEPDPWADVLEAGATPEQIEWAKQHALEGFKFSTNAQRSPRNPDKGDVWFKASTSELLVQVGGKWWSHSEDVADEAPPETITPGDPEGTVEVDHVGDEPPSEAKAGDIWVKPTTDAVYELTGKGVDMHWVRVSNEHTIMACRESLVRQWEAADLTTEALAQELGGCNPLSAPIGKLAHVVVTEASPD